MKTVNEHYKWRNPTINDRHPEFLEFLKTNPKYEEALHYRKVMLTRMQFANPPRSDRAKIDLFNLKDAKPLLKLVE